MQSKTNMKKCLTTWDLTSLGIGAVLGAGTYVVAGEVSANTAGPSVIISFFIAAFASLLSGLAYAEFGARVPHTTGGAYAYSYIAIGEIWAFFIGWNLILEYMIGTAADASALSASLEYLTNTLIGSNTTFPFSIPPFYGTNQPDVVAFIVTIAITILLSVGVKDSSRFAGFCNIINISVIGVVIISGAFYSSPNRWNSYEKFFPYGIGGTLSGAASCFYAFIGFDIIATTGEEAAEPSKSIPKAIGATLIIVLLCYIGVSSVINMMVNYFELSSRAPVSTAFQLVGSVWLSYLVAFGAIFGLASSLLGSMFPLPRIIYSMSSDGLIWYVFSIVNSRTGTPIYATILPGLITACFSLLFDLNELVEMMSIGTLLAYSLVSYCVLILRYQPDDKDFHFIDSRESTMVVSTQNIEKLSHGGRKDENIEDLENKDFKSTPSNNKTTFKIIINAYYLKLLEIFSSKKATNESNFMAMSFVFIEITCVMNLSAIFILVPDYVYNLNVFITAVVIVNIFILIVSHIIICNLPQNDKEVSFKAPFVPTLPVTAIHINTILMLKLSQVTWIRFIIWMIIGILP